MRYCSWLLVVFMASVSLGAEDGFVALVKGDDPAQFDLIGIDPDALKIVNGEIKVMGKPHGYFVTKAIYRDYVLKCDWIYERPEGLADDAKFDGNSGLFLHVQKPHKVWPKSIEVQLMNADSGNLFAIFGAKFTGSKDAQAQKKAIKPVGQWNHLEVTCQNGRITSTINGVEVSRGTGASPDSGQIGWQCEGTPIQFRRIMIKELKGD
ncbi:protein of unknown function [Singulisphaera sp. GP187]|uniref:3-keto-disaccharide hydrolase n=1 Tax=Singulisphaera sp. GP187 TaxID=1882752 RepID=UPI000925BA23|nr:DUF1080 domain-containing protein [Singulisphaera sp. GP187]SIO20793.1 protein of unknown function [Singulisphaera sp. GP187]